MPELPDTVTAEESVESRTTRSRGASLILAFQAERPLEPPRAFALAGSDASLARGRGPTQVVIVGKEMRIELQDRFVSSPHASVHKIYDRWVLQDVNSRNGTFVDGADVDRCELRDGMVVEIGRSFFVFREQVPADAPSLEEGLATLNAVHAAQLRALMQVAASSLPVVLRGETGTGKEVLAQAVHRLSGRSGAFQAINCAALAQSVAESELFGYRKGAFSGATEDRPGLIRSAEGGTLFLDEIGDLPLQMQALLLRVLQEGEVLPVGATRPVPVDFRLIVATHRNLESMADSGTFRPDLLARLAGFTLQLPALRERLEDLGALTAALLRRHAGARAEEISFSLAAARALFRYPWPRNVRELEKALAMAVTLCHGGRIEPTHLPAALGAVPDAAPPPQMLSGDPEKRREELVALLRVHHGSVAAVARAVGKARMQVHRWMRQFGIRAADFR